MNLLSKLLGRKPETSANLAAEIDARKVALSEAHARVSAAASARAKALADLDGDGMARADVDAADAARAVELGAKALDILMAALAKAVVAEEAEARVAALAVLVERRRVLGQRLESEYRAAAATMASVLSALAELQRDVAEGGFDREVDPSPDVSRGLLLNTEAVANVSTFLNDALASRPAVPESPKERAWRDAEEARARRKAAEAEARRLKLEVEREEARASHEAADAKARQRTPFYGVWRDHLTDAAR